jgi:hypothetical protein
MQLQHQGPSPVPWSEQEATRARHILSLLDNVAALLYFASAAHDTGSDPDEAKPTPEQQQRFYHEGGPVIDLLVGVGYPSITHHLLETLEAFVSHDPRSTFLRMAHAVQAGELGGYQFESMGADLVVKLVERYLAEYRRLVQEDVECRDALLNVIDIFVRAGWPSAHRLTYRLEDVFR